jgi:flagellar biosynthetic protein FliR
LPMSMSPFSGAGFYALAAAAGQIFVLGLLLALPMIAALLITNVALGVISRAAPQLNLFAVGFPVTLTTGFVVLLMSLPYLAPHFSRLYEDGVSAVLGMLDLLAGSR